jgi:HK97 family phage major capsid protein
MDKILEMKNKKFELIKTQRAMIDKADEEKRKLTDDENVEYKKLDGEIEKLERDILDAEADLERRRTLAEKELASKKSQDNLRINIDHKLNHDPEKEFKNIGEYFYTLVSNPRDKRLDELRAQSMGTGSEGGYALPEQFRPEILQVQPQDAIVRSRSTVIPAGSPPDAKLTMPALDQTSGSNIYGGVVITHTGEGITMTETDAKLREVTMEPKEISAYIITTNKLLNNWDAASSFLTTQLRKAMAGAEDYDFMRGDGINKALGFINASCAVTATRAGAGAIAYADIYNMYARLKMGGNPLWIASQTTIPSLVTIVDAGSHALWVGGGNLPTGISTALPPTLFGIPIVFADRLPALGTSGDINLVDLQYYLIKDGSGPFAAVSTELLFLSNRTVFKVVWNVDAKPWLTEAIGLEGATTSTVSPFVKLS